MAAREYWTAGKWVRVTDDLNETKWVGINQPIRVMDRLAEMPEQMRVAMMQRMQLQPGDPRLQQVIGIENDITDLDVDITIDEGIDIPSLQAEQFQTLGADCRHAAGIDPGRRADCGLRAQGQGQAAGAHEGAPAAAAAGAAAGRATRSAARAGRHPGQAGQGSGGLWRWRRSAR